jgi:hypothetical protein
MNEPRRPVFWFLWPRPDPSAPVDDAYHQVRAIRISPRGPIRVALLVVSSVIEVIVMGMAVVGALGSGISVYAVVGAAIAASGLFLLLRGWVVGTYVNDYVLTIETTFRKRSLPWSQVADVSASTQRCPFLGLPLRTRSTRVIVTDTSGLQIGTHVYATSPDYWLRSEAFDMAAQRIERWAQDSRRP